MVESEVEMKSSSAAAVSALGENAGESSEKNAALGRRKSFSNSYAAKKTVAQGMMDIALITANANQLRYLLEYNKKSAMFFLVLGLIILSLLLQVMVGVFLIFKGRYDMEGGKQEHAIRINNYVVLGVFIITIVNVFITAFSIAVPPSDSAT